MKHIKGMFFPFQWTVVEQACNAFSVVPVALYDTLGDQAVQFVINQSKIRRLFHIIQCPPKVLGQVVLHLLNP